MIVQHMQIGKNLFHRIFLQYKGTWAWRNFCATKIGYMVSTYAHKSFNSEN